MKEIYGLILLFFVTQSEGIIKAKNTPFGDDISFMIALTDAIDIDIHKPMGGNITCGGVIIAPQWILTAASCAKNTTGMGAIGGMFFPSLLSSNLWQKREVDFAIKHEKYKVGQAHHDIALIHVSEPFVWTERVRPPALPQRNEIPSGEVSFYGYGQVTIGYSTEFASDIRKIKVNIMDWNQCRQLLPQVLLLDDRMVCTKQLPRQSFCIGDYGGPLVTEHKNGTPLLVGIASWAYAPCGFKQYPNVYTQVSLYLTWIKENMKLFEY